MTRIGVHGCDILDVLESLDEINLLIKKSFSDGGLVILTMVSGDRHIRVGINRDYIISINWVG